jgi:hypothetical protein
MVQGGGVPSWQSAGPAPLGAGASVVSVLGVLVHPTSTYAVIKKQLMNFTTNP